MELKLFFVREFYKYSFVVLLVFTLLLNISFIFLTGSLKNAYNFGHLAQRAVAVYHYTGYSLFESGFFSVHASASEISSHIYDTYASTGNNASTSTSTSTSTVSDEWGVSAPLLLNSIISQLSNYNEMYVASNGGMGVTAIAPNIYASYGGGSGSPFDYRSNIDATYTYFMEAFAHFGSGVETPLALFLLGEQPTDFAPWELSADEIRAMLGDAGREGDFNQILYLIGHKAP